MKNEFGYINVVQKRAILIILALLVVVCIVYSFIFLGSSNNLNNKSILHQLFDCLLPISMAWAVLSIIFLAIYNNYFECILKTKWVALSAFSLFIPLLFFIHDNLFDKSSKPITVFQFLMDFFLGICLYGFLIFSILGIVYLIVNKILLIINKCIMN